MKIGFLSLPLTGHLNPMTALARKLKSRGHEVVFVGVPDIEPVARAADLDFVPFGENEYPPGSIAERWGRVANLHGLDVVRYTARELTPGLVKAAFEHLPGKIAETGVNALILDTAYRLIEIVPMHLRLPYVQIWNVLHFDFSGSTPLALYSWPHETSPEALVNGLNKVYGAILEAVGEFPEMQVVLSVGRNVNPADLGSIPSNTIVVRVAPQIELLKRSALCITHAGLNTALEALAQGVPMVAIPIGYDQPGVAARIAYHGVGEFVEIGNLTAQHLSKLIIKVTANPSYRDKAGWFQKVLGETRGLDKAADIIERVFGEHFEGKEAVAATSFSSRDTNR